MKRKEKRKNRKEKKEGKGRKIELAKPPTVTRGQCCLAREGETERERYRRTNDVMSEPGMTE